MPRKRGNKKKKSGQKATTPKAALDDDVMAFLDSAPQTETVTKTEEDASPTNDNTPTPVADVDDALAFLGIDDAPAASSKKKKKKKKKKPKTEVKKGKKNESAVAKAARMRREQKEKADAEAKRLEEEEARRHEEELAEAERIAELKRAKRRRKKEREKQAKLAGKLSKKDKKKVAGKRGRLMFNVQSSTPSARVEAPKSPKPVENKKKEVKPVEPPVEQQSDQPVDEPKAVETATPVSTPNEPEAENIPGKSWEDGLEENSKDGGSWDDANFDDVNFDEVEFDDVNFGSDDDDGSKQKEDPKPKTSKKTSSKGKEKPKKLSKKEKKALKKAEQRRARHGDTPVEDEETARERAEEEDLERRIQASRDRFQVARREARMRRVSENLRSPIVCVMGHVDTGKTLLLDKLRQTDVQKGEFGGITQQIGATFMPIAALKQKVSALNEDYQFDCRLPGLLMIDTPGHESFSNLRSRGSSLCDIAVLVVDVMHYLEPQTIESLKMLRERRTPFIVALNKIDRLYDWKVCGDTPIREALAVQEDHVIDEFHSRLQKVKTELMEQGLNSELYFENKELTKTVSICPISAMTGEGIQDLLLLILKMTQEKMTQKLMYMNFVQCVVLELKVIEGLGPTADVMLVNGEIKLGDTMVFCTIDGPVVTKVRALLTPPVMRDARIKSEYIRHDSIKGAMGVKIAAEGLEKIVAGSECMLYTPEYEIEHFKEEVMEGVADLTNLLRRDGRGVRVQASTLGSLEALLTFLRSLKPPIPVGSFSVGPIFKKDVLMASTMLEKKREFATILAFDVKVNAEARAMADDLGVRIFTANIIYHLFDQFSAYMNDLRQAARDNSNPVFPCVLEILPQYIFNKKNPIVIGVKVLEGIVKPGTPLCVVKEDADGNRSVLTIGTISTLELNNKSQESARSPSEVCIKIEQSQAENFIMYGRQFNAEHKLFSLLSRSSIDALKANFKDDLEKGDINLIFRLKKMFNIL